MRSQQEREILELAMHSPIVTHTIVALEFEDTCVKTIEAQSLCRMFGNAERQCLASTSHTSLKEANVS